MLTRGLSSVLGNRDSSSKKGHTAKDDEWYIPYNGPYETPPVDATTWMRKPRDSWGDPIPGSSAEENLELSGNEGVGPKHSGYDRHKAYSYVGDAGIKYGVHGVFDDDWKGVAVSGVGRYGGASEERERGRRSSRGQDFRPTPLTTVDAGKTNFSSAARRRSTVSSGGPYAISDYVSSPGGVGESPMPHSRGSKDAQRVSLASIFTFGAKMKTGSPTGSVDGGRERRDSTDSSLKRSRRNTGSTKDKVVGHRDSGGSFADNVQHQHYPLSPKLSMTKRHPQHHDQSDKHNSLGADEESYYNYYDSFYSTLLDSPSDPKGQLFPLRRPAHRRQQHMSTTVDNSNTDQRTHQLQPRTTRTSPQNLIPTSGHPYAPYSHHTHVSQDHNRDLHDDRTLSYSGNDNPPVFRQQRHPYNQAQSTYVRHPFGQGSISTGTSSSSYQSHHPTYRSTRSHGHGESHPTLVDPRSKVAFVAQGAMGTRGAAIGSTGKKLKSSTSTPNLRQNRGSNAVAGPSNRQVEPPVPPISVPQKQPPPNIKDRWLSAETWCDALIFPRPRLKVKEDSDTSGNDQGGRSPITSQKGSGRIVSPPASPLDPEWEMPSTSRTPRNHSGPERQREPGVASRVLAHSRSLVELSPTTREKMGYPNVMPPGVASKGEAEGTLKRGISHEELAFPVVEPSVDEVLAERQLLEEQRQAWQALAFNSLGNKRSRSLSRTRTKSLTKRGRDSIRKKPNNTVDTTGDSSAAEDQEHRAHDYLRQSSFEYLTAQACLGNQNVAITPNMATAKIGFSGPDPDTTVLNSPGPGITRAISTGTNSGLNDSRLSHSHSNSHATSRTMTTRSSRSQKKSHSRNGSLSNTTTGRMGKLCGNPGLDVDLALDDIKSTNVHIGHLPEGLHHRATPDLEDALKRQGTRVIRLADPAHIPVDKGMPVSQSVLSIHHERKTPSPALSATSSLISESKVGIALGVPPEEAEAMALGGNHIQNHPYAQMGTPFGGNMPPSSGRVGAGAADSPSAVGSGNIVAPISDIPNHPYATGAGGSKVRPRFMNITRDSYLDAHGLIGRFRSEDRTPDPSKMWAQLSPDAVREVLPGDLQYSPFSPGGKGDAESDGTQKSQGRRDEDRIKSIHDTAGVTEALLNATRLDLDQDHPVPLRSRDANTSQRDGLVAVDPSSIGMVARTPSLAIPATTGRQESISSVLTSENSSPRLRLLGSPNDLDSFHDLFYQPSPSDNHAPASPETAFPANAHTSWDEAVRNRRTGSSLTSLARQLGEEYEAIAMGNPSSFHPQTHSRSRSLSALPQHSGSFGLSTEGHLHFVLEEAQRGESPAAVLDVGGTLRAFQLPRSLPEDVHSSRASSLVDNPEEEEDPTAMLRLGMVESVSTPSAVNPELGERRSFNGETIFGQDGQQEIHPTPGAGSPFQTNDRTAESGDPLSPSDNQSTALSPRPLTQLTRSSYMTTSDLSRMSGLSDFPVPPKTIQPPGPNTSFHMTPQHISPFQSNFDEKPDAEHPPPLRRDSHDSQVSPNVALNNSSPDCGQVEFGSNQSADELAQSLSSPYPFTT